MIRYFLLALGILAGAVGLGILIQHDPGYILITIGNSVIETSFWVGLVLFLLLLTLGHLLMRFFQASWRDGNRLGRYVAKRRQKRGIKNTNDGLIAIIEGNYLRARQLLSKDLDQIDDPLLNYLGAALAADELGDSKAAEALLAKAGRETQGADIAIELMQARLLYKRGRLEEALASLTRSRKNAAKHPAVLRLLSSVYTGLKDWDALLELLPDLKKSHVFSTQELEQLRRTVGLGQLEKFKTAPPKDPHSKNTGKPSSEQLTQWWNKLPSELQKDNDVLVGYARQLIASDNQDLAEKLLRSQLRKTWDRELITLYGLVASSEPDKQLLSAEGWLKERNNDPALLLTLGRLSLRNQLWGKAREYLENSHRLEPGAEVCAELGRLLAYLGEHERSTAFFQEGLLKNTNTMPLTPPHKPSQHTRVA